MSIERFFLFRLLCFCHLYELDDLYGRRCQLYEKQLTGEQVPLAVVALPVLYLRRRRVPEELQPFMSRVALAYP